MAENEGKTPRANDDDETPEEGERSEGAASEPAARSKASASAAGEGDAKRPATKSAKPASTTSAAKARPTSTRDDDEDDEYDDEGDDEDDLDDEDDDEVDEPPPPKRPVASKTSSKATSKAAPGAAKKGTAAAKGKSSVYRKAPPPVRVAPRRPARYYVPYIGLGLGFVALHVWFDLPYQPVACLGIAIVIWAYLQIGSANEIIPGER